MFRPFLLLLLAVAPVFTAPKYQNDKFVIALLKYEGDWDTRSQGVKSIAVEVMNRTSVNMPLHPRPVTLSDPDLFYFPFLLMTGSRGFPSFTPTERQRFRRYLESGGFLLIDNSAGVRDNDFDKAVRREMTALFPDSPLSVLDADHSIYRSFYLMRRTYFGGRVKSAPYLEGVTLGDLTPVIYSLNDAAGAWMRDPSGNFVFDAIPGGELQRRDAFKFGVNAVIYALTANYKKDAVHAKAILKRRRR
ncbi:MAG: DUF4159 domain-containing protein [Fibrobacterota bacterium]